MKTHAVWCWTCPTSQDPRDDDDDDHYDSDDLDANGADGRGEPLTSPVRPQGLQHRLGQKALLWQLCQVHLVVQDWGLVLHPCSYICISIGCLYVFYMCRFQNMWDWKSGWVLIFHIVHVCS